MTHDDLKIHACPCTLELNLFSLKTGFPYFWGSLNNSFGFFDRVFGPTTCVIFDLFRYTNVNSLK